MIKIDQIFKPGEVVLDYCDNKRLIVDCADYKKDFYGWSYLDWPKENSNKNYFQSYLRPNDWSKI